MGSSGGWPTSLIPIQHQEVPADLAADEGARGADGHRAGSSACRAREGQAGVLATGTPRSSALTAFRSWFFSPHPAMLFWFQWVAPLCRWGGGAMEY